MAAIFRAFVEKLGGSEAATYVGNTGDMFYDPTSPSLRISDGTTPGGVPLGDGSAVPQVAVDWDATTGVTAILNKPIIESMDLPDGTMVFGNANTNGIAIGNNKEYKAVDVMNPGEYIAVARVDENNHVYLSSPNGNTTNLMVGGLEGQPAVTVQNGGNIFVKKQIKLGSPGGTVMGGEIDIVDTQEWGVDNGTGGIGIASYRDSDLWGSYVYGVRYRGTLAAPAACQTGDALMEFGCLGWDGAAPVGGGELMWVVDGTVEAGKVPAKAELYITNDAGATSVGLTVEKNGNVKAAGALITSGGTAPATSKGAVGDKKGTMIVSGDYLYFCVADYTDGVADIWKRVTDATTW